MTQLSLQLSQTRRSVQPWLSSAYWDILFILSPAFVSALVALAFKAQMERNETLPFWAWVCFILFIDVAHVYGTLFRTYLDQRAFARNRFLLLAIPVVCWTIGSVLYSMSEIFFWRVLAYLAVFHFVRQQYGFMMMYARKDPAAFERYRWLDAACLYMATIYPLLFWHTHLPRNFTWFVNGDFVDCIPSFFAEVALVGYVLMAVTYIIKETALFRSTGFINFPKNLLLIGTGLSWWVGIVYLDSDLAFTMTNVVSHGIPYLALIWLYHHQSSAAWSIRNQNLDHKPNPLIKLVLTYLPLFLVFLLALSYLEEGLWDGLVWREHLQLFALFWKLPSITDPVILALLVPLLSLPQSTHYVLDGFIWRVRDKSSIWST